MTIKSTNGGDKSITQPSIQVQEAHIITSLKLQNLVITNFDFQEYAVTKTNIINTALEIAVPLQNPIKIHEAMRQSLLRDGDKRIRGVLCLAACELFGGNEYTAIPIACAVEMIHNINADSPENYHNAFREATKLLARGSLMSLAFKHGAANTGNVDPRRVVRVFAELASAVGSKGLVAGELADLCSEGKGEVGVDELEYIHVHKTSRVFEAAVVCGAVMGGGDGVGVERLRKYGRYIGLLCEVVDDILDVTKSESSEEFRKKTVGKDLVSNAATYPGLMGLEKAKAFAGELAAKAVEELSDFDALKAAPLFHFADYVASGEN